MHVRMVAGIPMRDLLAACMVGLIQDTPVLDLNQLEEQASRGPQLFVALHCSLQKARPHFARTVEHYHAQLLLVRVREGGLVCILSARACL